MPDNADDQIVDTLSIENLKTVAGGSAFATNLAHNSFAQAAGLAAQNAVTTQQRMNDVGVQAAQVFANNMHHLDLAQATAMQTVKGADLAQLISQLVAAVSGAQQSAKTAGNTPPVTP